MISEEVHIAKKVFDLKFHGSISNKPKSFNRYDVGILGKKCIEYFANYIFSTSIELDDRFRKTSRLIKYIYFKYS